MAGISATHRWNVHQFTRTILEHVKSARQERWLCCLNCGLIWLAVYSLIVNLSTSLLQLCNFRRLYAPINTFHITNIIYFLTNRELKHCITSFLAFGLYMTLGKIDLFLGTRKSILKGSSIIFENGVELSSSYDRTIVEFLVYFLYDVDASCRIAAWRRGVTLF